MKILAPIAVIVAVAALLYKTEEVWAKEDYDAAYVKVKGNPAVTTGPQIAAPPRFSGSGASGTRPRIDVSQHAPMAAGWTVN